MAKFRADHYLLAEFENPERTKDGQKILEALKEISELKDLAIVSKRLEGKNWQEILGRIDIPAGSKAFWAMVKNDVSEREPYNLLIRLDVNGEGADIEEARAKVKSWVEGAFIPRIKAKVPVKTINVHQANEIYMPDLA
ncbi:MAG: hypothetical protein KAW94_03925 [Candidatus Thorarchaeota archaeon]|jgi:hypothetical protein|nr:hypothetical protein [Candidatus Thorarchaeota archaeon]